MNLNLLIRSTANQCRAAFISIFLALVLFGQSPCTESLDPQFFAPGDGTVFDMVDFDDGSGTKLYIGGIFTDYAGLPVRSIVGYDGTNFFALPGGVTAAPGPALAAVRSMVVFDFGAGPRLVLAGNFGFAGGVAVQNIAAYDGTSFSPIGASVSGAPNSTSGIRKMVVFDDGSGPALYAIGSGFIDSAGQSIGGIARWTSAGWTSVGSAPNLAANSVFDMAVHTESNGSRRLYVGGQFSGVANVPQTGLLAAWDGTQWIGGTGLLSVGVVRSLASVDFGGGPRLYLGGNALATPSGQLLQNLAYWDGTIFTSVGATGFIDNLRVVDHGSGPVLYGSGNVSSVAGVSVRSLFGLSGTVVNAFGFGAILGDQPRIGLTTVGNAVPRLVAAPLRAIDTTYVNGIAFYDGTSWTSPALNGVGGTVYALAHDSRDGSVYAAGDFLGAGSTICGGIARFDGNQWFRIGNGVGFYNGTNVPQPPLALFFGDDGNGPSLFVAGNFTSVDGIPAQGVVRWRNGSWNPMPGITPFSAQVTTGPRCFAVYDANGARSVYVGMNGGVIAGAQASVARWTGTTWVPLPNISGGVQDIKVFDDGGGPRLFVCGPQLTINGVASVQVAAWNGSQWQIIGQGFGAVGQLYANSLTVHDEGTGPALFLGGGFNSFNGAAMNHIARWTGTTWVDRGPPLFGHAFPFPLVTRLESMPTSSGPALVAAGSFGLAPAPANDDLMILRNGSWTGFGANSGGYSGVDGLCLASTVSSGPAGPSLWIGGSFATFGSVTCANIARWSANSSSGCSGLGLGSRGRFGETVGGPYDLLTINGQAGGATRTVSLGIGQPVTITMSAPPFLPTATLFEIFGFIGAPQPADVSLLPFNLGYTAFPFCPTAPSDVRLFELTNNIAPSACTALFPSAPTPWSMTLPFGLPFPLTFALQGIAYDTSSPSVISTTNAVQCRIQ